MKASFIRYILSAWDASNKLDKKVVLHNIYVSYTLKVNEDEKVFFIWGNFCFHSH